jgi:hypothetical protein
MLNIQYHVLLFYLSISAFYLEPSSCAPSTLPQLELPQWRGNPQSGAQLRPHSCPHNISRVHLCRSESRIVIIECSSRTAEREVFFIKIHSFLVFSSFKIDKNQLYSNEVVFISPLARVLFLPFIAGIALFFCTSVPLYGQHYVCAYYTSKINQITVYFLRYTSNKGTLL